MVGAGVDPTVGAGVDPTVGLSVGSFEGSFVLGWGVGFGVGSGVQPSLMVHEVPKVTIQHSLEVAYNGASDGGLDSRSRVHAPCELE